jgi:hypothetical protein
MRYCITMIMLVVANFHTGYSQDTIQVKTGWNIVGSLGSGVVSDLFVTCPPGILTSAMYEYIPGAGYKSTDTLKKGVGYWVKVTKTG